jgi:putative hydrolase of HD superfamily
MLKDYANENIDIDRVIKMLLIHDLGEIDAGDTIIYESETPAIKVKELAGIKRILAVLPESKGEEYLALWLEFESGETADSIYAKAIDRVPPLLHNLYGNGHSWNKHGIQKEQVFTVNQRIANGSEDLWEVMKIELEKAVEKGILN